jgi:hypothetical protein
MRVTGSLVVILLALAVRPAGVDASLKYSVGSKEQQQDEAAFVHPFEPAFLFVRRFVARR